MCRNPKTIFFIPAGPGICCVFCAKTARKSVAECEFCAANNTMIHRFTIWSITRLSVNPARRRSQAVRICAAAWERRAAGRAPRPAAAYAGAVTSITERIC